MYRLLTVENAGGWGWDRPFVKPRVEGGLGRCRGGICSCRVLEILFGASLLFLVWKALCSLVHCFNRHQEIRLCSGSAMPLVPACSHPGGQSAGLFHFVRHQDHCCPFSFCCPPYLHEAGKGKEEKRDSSESLFLYKQW